MTDRSVLTRIEELRTTLVGVRGLLEDDPRDDVRRLVELATMAVEELEISIEELTQALAELTGARNRIEAERQRYQELFDLAPEGYLVTDDEGVIGDANQAASLLLGVPVTSLRGKPLGAYLASEDLSRLAELQRAAGADPIELRAAIQPRQGPSFPAALRVVRAVEPDGVAMGLRWSLRNESTHVQLEDRLSYLAMHDGLTGLPNRGLLFDRLDQLLARAARHGSGVVVCFIDIDGMKDVNDSLGHRAGDELLSEFARRLMAITRPDDTSARLGGDEFVLAWEGDADAEAISAVGRRILEVCRTPFELDGHPVTVEVSAGIATSTTAGADAEQLLNEADLAMYEMKEAGGGDIRVFDEELRRGVGHRMAVNRDLRSALADEQLRLVAQPVVALDDHRVVGAELLLRWYHPTRGEQSPARFIPVAERSGLIVDIGRWVLDEAMAIVDRSGAAAGFTWAVNLSGRQLSHPELVAEVGAQLDRTGVDGERLCFEITETALMRDLDVVDHVLQPLADRGIRFAIDDFGTGYSSMAYLARVPVAQVKVDQSFVRDMVQDRRSYAIVDAIVHLSRALGFEVLAEGVETEAQERALVELGVRWAQGFRFARPMPVAELEALLASGGHCPPA